MIIIHEIIVRRIILLFLWMEYIWETYLSIRQFNKARRTNDVPDALRTVMKQEEFDKAKQYSLAKLRFGFVKETQSILLTTALIYYGVLANIWDYAHSINPVKGEVTTSCMWLYLLSLLSTIIELPFSIYHTFMLEEKFGFNKQTVSFFVWDKVKAFFVSQLITAIISSVIIVIVKNGGPYFFVWVWLVVCVISMLLLTIYPAVIAPLFDTYTPLPEGELRTQIENLASQLKFPLTQLYVVEGSKRSSHSNAYFYGLFKSKRIVLFDTLLAKDDGSGCQNDEILAVLSHELGHWNYNHIYKNLVLMQVNLFLLFAGFAYMFKYPPLYKALGFYNTQPVLVGLFVVLQYVMMPHNTILSFVMTVLSRKFEFQADNFAVELGKAEALERALLQLNKDNSGFPINDDLYSAWHHSHPPRYSKFYFSKMLWITLITTLFVASSCFSDYEDNNVHILDPGETFHFNSKGPMHLEIFCYKGKPKNIIYIWQTIILQLIHHTDDFSIFEGFDPEDVRKQYEEKQSFWSLNIFSPRLRNVKLNPFNASCIGIESRETYTVKLNVIRIDFWKISMLVTGLLLFLSADTLSKNVIFHYICGISVGISASFLIIIYLVSKVFPKKPFMYGIIGCGWTVVIYCLQLLWENIQLILTGYKYYVIWYIIGTGLLSFILCYRWGPVENKRTINLIKWSMQLLGLFTIFNSSHYQEAAMGQIFTLLIAYNIPKKWVAKPKTYWKRKFPPKVNLLTEDEYHEQGVRETAKALEELRKYCASPDCNQWKTITKIKDVKRFASFVEGNSHLSDEEILEYETSIQGELTDDERDDEFTDEEC